jgi:DNA replication protein DnaC
LRLANVFDRFNRSRAFDAASYYSFMDDLKSVQLLILDDFLTTPIATQNAVDLFEILEGRYEKVATLIASQLEPHEWYLWIEGESMADSILGRVASAARCYDLDGPDMRRYFAKDMPEL